jgi:malate dehydrogenase (oxaloacetate-decarboxylating)(NADP+)
LGLRQGRERGPSYDALVKEFFEACQDKFGRNVLIQFEDFGNQNAFRLLQEYQDKACTFNDDIQGTGAVAVAGLLASTRLTGKHLSDHTFLFLGAGEAAKGIADLIAYKIYLESNVSMDEARKKIFLVDSKGLVTKARLDGLQRHKVLYAHEVTRDCPNLLSAVEYLKPTCLIGVSAQPKTFTKEILEKMTEWSDHPIICALSNPTSKAECTAEEAYEFTNGKAIFAGGSPFAPVTLKDGSLRVPGQGNNVYVFPGVGLGVLAAGSSKVTNHDMLIAAECLAAQVTQEQLDIGCVYPPLSEIRNVSSAIALAVADNAYTTGVATRPRPDDLLAYIESIMYNPFDLTE